MFLRFWCSREFWLSYCLDNFFLNIVWFRLRFRRRIGDIAKLFPNTCQLLIPDVKFIKQLLVSKILKFYCQLDLIGIVPVKQITNAMGALFNFFCQLLMRVDTLAIVITNVIQLTYLVSKLIFSAFSCSFGVLANNCLVSNDNLGDLLVR